MLQPGKRRKLATAAASAGCTKASLRRLLAALKASSDEEELPTRRQVAEAISAHANTETPYGRVMQVLEFDTPTGLVRLPFIDPFALLHVVCAVCQSFATFLRDSLPDGSAHFIVYMDEVKPGNVLRPDKGRQTWCLYWNFSNLPGWWRCRQLSWFTAITARTCVVQHIEGQASAVMAAFLRKVFSPRPAEHNLQRSGVRLPCGSGAVFHLRARLVGVLGDEKALKEIFCAKGSSGTKPCLCCKNLVHQRRVNPDAAPDPYWVDLTCPSLSLLDLHTDESVFHMADRVAAQVGRGSAADFRLLQQATGLAYSPAGLLWQLDLRSVVQPISGLLWDWMHILVCSGVATDEAGYFLQAVCSEGVSLAQIDEFVGSWTPPKAQGKLAANFCSARSRDMANGGSFRAFAGELLTLVPVLAAFCRQVLLPSGRLARHAHCWLLLSSILQLLQTGDRVVRQLDPLQRRVEEHHALFCDLYGSEKAKPKLHYLLHLVPTVRHLGSNLSCFVVERKHRAAKAVAAAAFRHFESVVTTSLVNQHVEEFAALGSIKPDRLVRPQKLPEAIPILQEVLADVVADVSVSKHASLGAAGGVHAGDVVSVICETGMEIGAVECFFEVTSSNGEVVMFAQAQ